VFENGVTHTLPGENYLAYRLQFRMTGTLRHVLWLGFCSVHLQMSMKFKVDTTTRRVKRYNEAELCLVCLPTNYSALLYLSNLSSIGLPSKAAEIDQPTHVFDFCRDYM
jgi:hypothetical protein